MSTSHLSLSSPNAVCSLRPVCGVEKPWEAAWLVILECLEPTMATVPNSQLQGSRSGGRESDYRLVTRIVHRDEGAFGAIYDRYSRVVYSVVLHVVRDAAIAEDILHDIFLNLWRSPQQFDGARGKLAPWLAVIARNRAIDWIRKQRPQEDLADVQLVADEDLAGEVERKSAIERVRVVLNALPEKQRAALELAFFRGLTHADIAAQEGVPLGTIKTRIRTALLSDQEGAGAMNTHEISADDLTLFAMHSLESLESSRISEHLGSCSSCRGELQRIRTDLAAVALTAPEISPPPRLRERLFADIRRDSIHQLGGARSPSRQCIPAGGPQPIPGS